MGPYYSPIGMRKIGLVKFYNFGIDGELLKTIEQLEARGFKIATLVRLLIKKHAKEYLKSG